MKDELHVVSTKVLLRSLMKRDPKAKGPEFDLGAQQKVLLDILSKGRIVSRDELFKELWGNRTDGGPLEPYGGLRRRIWMLRGKGYPIRTHGMRGFSLGIY